MWEGKAGVDASREKNRGKWPITDEQTEGRGSGVRAEALEKQRTQSVRCRLKERLEKMTERQSQRKANICPTRVPWSNQNSAMQQSILKYSIHFLK